MTYDKNNVFAKIISGEIPSKKIYENKYVFAFEDAQPTAPVHVLVVPKGEYISFNDFVTKGSAEEILGFFNSVQIVAKKLNLEEEGYRLISNHGPAASQSVPHFHVHILGGKNMGRLLP